MKTQAQTATARLRVWWWLPVGWVLMGFLFTLQTWLWGQARWEETLRFGLMDWVPWVVLAPGVGWLAFRFPLGSGGWLKPLAVHGVACVVVTLLLELVAWHVMPRRGGPPPERVARGMEVRPVGGSGPAGSGGPWAMPPGGMPPRRVGSLTPWMFRVRLTAPLYWLLVAAAHLVLHRQLAEERERRVQAELVEARLMALQLQLQPHFLFNCLNGISAFIPTQPERAERMLLALSRLLHAALASGNRREVTLAEELECAGAYLQIQEIRFGGSLRVEREVAPELMLAAVPPLLLQPLLENAVVHGLAGQPGLIRLSVTRAGERLRLRVEDRREAGRPIKAGEGHGIGLGNTRQRLQTLYGANQRLELVTTPKGSVAEVEVPWRVMGPAEGQAREAV